MSRSRVLLLLALLVAPAAVDNPAVAQTPEALLGDLYPRAALQSGQVVLTPSQRRRALEQADADIPAVPVTRYVATRDGAIVGRAYLDTHTVRSRTATLLIALDGEGQVLRVDVTAFVEPDEPRPPASWLQQFQGMTLTDDLSVNRAIQPMATAPFTTRAMTSAVRRVLAIDAVLQAASPP